jgi:hypothetical protein
MMKEDFWRIMAIEGAKMGQIPRPVKQPAERVRKAAALYVVTRAL